MLKIILNVSKRDIQLDTHTVKSQEEITVDYDMVSERFKEKARILSQSGLLRIYDYVEAAPTVETVKKEESIEIVEPEPKTTKSKKRSKESEE